MIKQFLSVLVGLLLFVAPAFGMEPCFICKDKDPEICLEGRFELTCDHSFHPTCIHQWSLTNPICPRCRTPIAPILMRYLKHIFKEQNPPSSSDPVSRVFETGEQNSPDILSRTSASRRRTLLVVCGCAGIAAMIFYYFKDSIGELCWCKKDTEPVDIEPQKIV